MSGWSYFLCVAPLLASSVFRLAPSTCVWVGGNSMPLAFLLMFFLLLLSFLSLPYCCIEAKQIRRTDTVVRIIWKSRNGYLKRCELWQVLVIPTSDIPQLRKYLNVPSERKITSEKIIFNPNERSFSQLLLWGILSVIMEKRWIFICTEMKTEHFLWHCIRSLTLGLLLQISRQNRITMDLYFHLSQRYWQIANMQNYWHLYL